MSFRRGSILIIILWILGFLTILVINLASASRARLQYADHLQDGLRLNYLARAGIAKAEVELMHDLTPDYDALNESWANQESSFKELPLGSGSVTVSYHPEVSGLDAGVFLYGAMDESSRIDINVASSDILKHLLERVAQVGQEEATDISRAIVDWRDKDIALTPGGAEDEYYLSLTPPYKAKNGNFQIAEELLLIKGMTPEIFAKIKDLITVYPTGKVNINTASVACLGALGLTDSLCERIIKYRKGEDGLIGTADDGIFKTLADLNNIGSLFTEESTQINQLITSDQVAVKSSIFRINACGEFKDSRGVRQRNIVCVIKRQTEKPPQILYWHEN